MDVLKTARETLELEAAELNRHAAALDFKFEKAVELVMNCRGKLVVTGVGKSGHVGAKIAATLASTGTPSFFIHPTEALHGDLGMITKDDVIIMLSYSGETEEIKQVLPVLQKMNLKIIAITGKTDSPTWKNCNVIINSSVKKEACPYNLAPTSSTTALLALGDALALVVSQRKGFKKEDFAIFHPLGAIGNKIKRLTMNVKDIMRQGKANPVIKDSATVQDALLVMTGTRVGATSVVDETGKLVGFFTDGDLRRQIQLHDNLLKKRISEVMTKNPATVTPDILVSDAEKILREKNIDNIPVVDETGKPVGILDERDLFSE